MNRGSALNLFKAENINGLRPVANDTGIGTENVDPPGVEPSVPPLVTLMNRLHDIDAYTFGAALACEGICSGRPAYIPTPRRRILGKHTVRGDLGTERETGAA